MNFIFVRIFEISEYRKTLESAIKSETSSDFKRLLTSLCGARRDESGVVDQDAASEDATALFKAGEKRLGTDESKFHEIFCRRNYAQLKLVCCDLFNFINIIDSLAFFFRFQSN